jgi:hypothetical protein
LEIRFASLELHFDRGRSPALSFDEALRFRKYATMRSAKFETSKSEKQSSHVTAQL